MAEKLDSQSDDANSDEAERLSKPTPIYCDPCLGDNEHNLAKGFCIDCNDYLCTTCFIVHRKSRTSRNHSLKGESDMPVSKPNFADQWKKCPEHKYELVEYYCHSHKSALCKLCKSIDHRTCSMIEALDTVCNDTARVEEIQNMRDELERLQAGFAGNLNSARENRADIEAYHQKVIQDIRVIRDKDLQMMSAIENACLAVSPQMMSLKKDFDQLTNDKCFLFLMMLANKSQMTTLSKRLELMTLDNKFSKYRFVPSTEHQGDLGVIKTCPSKFTSIGVRTKSDKKLCYITGITRFSDTRLVLADFNNAKIKLVDLTYRSNHVVSELTLDIAPWDLTKLDERRIAVTAWNQKKILILSISEQITVTQTIDKSDFMHCCGIDFCNGEIIVSYLIPNEIQILDLGGTVKQTIKSIDTDGAKLFDQLFYIKRSPINDMLYLSDFRENKILSMTMDGKIVASFTHEYLKKTRGITVGTDGRVFVCCSESHKIFEISQDLSKGHIIFDEKDDIASPHGILYDEVDHKLYVGCFQKDMLQVFLV